MTEGVVDTWATWRIDGRVALVTGASRGIGRAIALGLAGAGADIIVHYASNAAAAERTAADISALGRRSHLVKGDLSEMHAGNRIAKEANALGDVDIVVLNATRSVRRPFEEISSETIAEEVAAGLTSGIALLQALLPGMAARGWGRVVTIGSVQQVRPNPALMTYAGIKSAMSNVVSNLARQYGPHGVTVNNVAPGLIATDSTAAQLGNPETLAALLDEIPLRSVGQPEDCVGTVLLLCSNAGRYITGSDIFVDGGMHLPGRPSFIGRDGAIVRQ